MEFARLSPKSHSPASSSSCSEVPGEGLRMESDMNTLDEAGTETGGAGDQLWMELTVHNL